MTIVLRMTMFNRGGGLGRKEIGFCGENQLLKADQECLPLWAGQGTRNPESGVATNKERLLPRRRVGEPARGVLRRTLQ